MGTPNCLFSLFLYFSLFEVAATGRYPEAAQRILVSEIDRWAPIISKQLELLRELVPATNRVAVIVDPDNVSVTESILREVEAAARAIGLKIQVLKASTSGEIDAAFASFAIDGVHEMRPRRR